MQIQHEENHAQGAFFILDDQQQRVAELTYYFIDEKTINKLYQALVAFIQENQLKLVPSCSYIAKKWQRDNP